jgi:hypothetical protein
MGTKVSELARNPFRPGMGLEPPYLADRQYQLQRFARFLDGFPDFPRNVRVTGLRGVGKTVLLQRYASAAQELGWIVVRRELGEHLRDETAFGLALIDDCRQALERTSRRATATRNASGAVRHALDLLGGISVSLAGVSITVKSPSSLAPRPQPVLEDQLFAALDATCSTAVASGRRGVLLCYDEAHVLRDSVHLRQFPLGALLAAVARAQRERVAVMLIVCGLPPLTDNLALAKSYSERMFQAEVLDALRPPEDVFAFTRPLAEGRRQLGPGVAEAVRADTHGYPFHLQFYGALLWDSVPAPEPITEHQFRSLRPEILEALDHAFFDARLARTSRFERLLLIAIAADGEAADLRAVLPRIGAGHDIAKRLISRLVNKGLIYRPERARLAFTVPMFGEYLRRKGHADG